MRRFGLICLSPITLLAMATALPLLPTSARATVFTNFESSQVHHLALAPDGSRLVACNTPQIQIFVCRFAAVRATEPAARRRLARPTRSTAPGSGTSPAFTLGPGDGSLHVVS